MTTTKELHVLMGGLPMGMLYENAGRHILVYDPSWIDRGNSSVPLSTSMPLIDAVHSGDVVTNFLMNLLPDNADTLNGWGKKFQTSPRNPFGLLHHVGEDCPGAVQFVRPDRIEAERGDGAIEWIDDAEVERRLAILRKDGATSGRHVGDIGQFSLAGAQPKTALTFLGGKWGVPSGRMPTTHILKPPSPTHNGHAENEHLCLSVFASIGTRSANTEVRRFGDEIAIVVKRFDRFIRDDRIVRLHQEDMCQSLGIGPSSKYESDGGPSLSRIAKNVLSRTIDPFESRKTLLKAAAYNFIIGGTDAHAKNYSIQIAGGARVRLSPMYDIASYLPYTPDIRRVKMANKVGGKYIFGDVMPRHWEAEAKSVGVDVDHALAPLRDMVARIPDAFLDAARASMAAGLDHASMNELVDLVARRCSSLAAIYGVEAKVDESPLISP